MVFGTLPDLWVPVTNFVVTPVLGWWERPSPVSAVDPGLAEDITGLLCRTCAEDGRTLVASLHQPQLARRFFPRIVGMSAGRIVFDLPAAEVDDARLQALFAGQPAAAA